MNVSEYSFYENISDELKYLEKVRGPKYLSLTLIVPITLTYVVIFVTGFVGNIITCIVIWRNPTMQTPTNYYLFNLAVSDLLFLILGLPFELSVFWQQYPWQWGLGICKLRAYVSETSSYVSVLTIVAFSIERYLAIYHPLRHYRSGLKRAIRSIFGAWLIALIFAMPFATYIDINYVEYPENSKRNSEESAICAMLKENMPEFPLYQLSCILFFLIPMVFIAVLYIRIGLRIQNDSLAENVEGYVHGETKQVQSRKTITRMLSAVVITFFICWAPFHVQRLLYVYEDSTYDDINQWVYPLTGCLYYFSTTINPILYNVMSAKYRNAFKETCRCSPSNPSITRTGLSSVRDSSVICGSNKRSQVFRGRDANRQNSCNIYASSCMENNLQGETQPDHREMEKRQNVPANDSLTAKKNNNEIVSAQFLNQLKKSSVLVHTKNGRLKYQVSDNDISTNETHI
ncbi:neuropeptides capa receptor-like isoform X1 [Apis cerana]|uniref:neuropeptides capa receptor-like isoform X1 n=1 Tax=Apis cerana TaxID=7461 RepID=UPI0007E2C70E|nr:neuropeptides capa receptor-like isoform X1 [Apis cerana]